MRTTGGSIYYPEITDYLAGYMNGGIISNQD